MLLSFLSAEIETQSEAPTHWNDLGEKREGTRERRQRVVESDARDRAEGIEVDRDYAY